MTQADPKSQGIKRLQSGSKEGPTKTATEKDYGLQSAATVERGQQLMPAQLDRARVEEKARIAHRAIRFDDGKDALMNPESAAVSSAWARHVESLNLNLRNRIRYDAESRGQQLSEAELNDREAREQANKLYNWPGVDVRSHEARVAASSGYPREVTLRHAIEAAQRNGHWPLPELHTGEGSVRKSLSFSKFEERCNAPPRQRDEATGSLAQRTFAHLPFQRVAKEKAGLARPFSRSGADNLTLPPYSSTDSLTLPPSRYHSPGSLARSEMISNREREPRSERAL